MQLVIFHNLCNVILSGINFHKYVVCMSVCMHREGSGYMQERKDAEQWKAKLTTLPSKQTTNYSGLWKQF